MLMDPGMSIGYPDEHAQTHLRRSLRAAVLWKLPELSDG